jgi:hypothetical protein
MPDDLHREPIEQLQEYLAGRRFLVLTGAGISTPSGIPDYRDSDGVRRGRQPMMYQEFLAKPEARRRYWARAMLGWPRLRQARPNLAHEALAALQVAERISGLITQNVDALHDQAGSRQVIELHGSLHRVLCLDCSQRSDRQQIQLMMETQNPYLAGVDAVQAPDGDTLLLPDPPLPSLQRRAAETRCGFFRRKRRRRHSVPRHASRRTSGWAVGGGFFVDGVFGLSPLSGNQGSGQAAAGDQPGHDPG